MSSSFQSSDESIPVVSVTLPSSLSPCRASPRCPVSRLTLRRDAVLRVNWYCHGEWTRLVRKEGVSTRPCNHAAEIYVIGVFSWRGWFEASSERQIGRSGFARQSSVMLLVTTLVDSV